jgi:N-acylneuraminate cytidylyltransferase
MPNKAVCIIPARGGSKRIPRKNIKDFCGKPVIAYSIEAALQSRLFEEVIVSTDDQEIAEIAEKFGASVPFMRSAKNSDDFATTADVLVEVLDKLETKYNSACCIYPCSPLIQIDKLKASFNLLEGDVSSVFPVVEYSTPIKRALNLNNANNPTFVFKENSQVRTQDLDKSYYDAGQFYWFDVDGLKQSSNLISEKSRCIILNELESQDIDNEADWKMAELKFQQRN